MVTGLRLGRVPVGTATSRHRLSRPTLAERLSRFLARQNPVRRNENCHREPGRSAWARLPGGPWEAARMTPPVRRCRARAHAPGRVNLIGDHTDYTGGLALPMAIDLGTDVVLERDAALGRVELTSLDRRGRAVVDLAEPLADAAGDAPRWARYVAGVVAAVAPSSGGVGTVSSTVPIGAGLASSAALEVAVALAVGAGGTGGSPVQLARACQEAEQLAVGVPCGVMDQLTSVCGQDGHAAPPRLRVPRRLAGAAPRGHRDRGPALGTGPRPGRLRLRRPAAPSARPRPPPSGRCGRRLSSTSSQSGTRSCDVEPAMSSPRTPECRRPHRPSPQTT